MMTLARSVILDNGKDNGKKENGSPGDCR